MRLDLDALDAGDRIEDGARLVVDAVVPPEVARIVVGDRLGRSAPHLELALRDKAVDELERMDDFVVPAKLRVLVGDRVETVRAARDDLPHAVLLERLDVLLRLHLPQVLVADASGRVAVAGLLGGEDGERDSGGAEDLHESARHLLIAPVVRRGAPDEVEVLGVGLFGERRHAQIVCPVAARFTRLAPGVAGTLDVRHRPLSLGWGRSLHERELPPHVDDLVDVLDRHGAGLNAGRTRRARPELFGFGFQVVGRWRRFRFGVAEDLRAVAEELIADVEDDLLRIEEFSGRECRAVVRAAPALRAGVAIEELLPRKVANGCRAEGLLILDVLDQAERPPRRLLAEEHVRKRRDDMEVFRLRKIRGERENRDDVCPPGPEENDGRRFAREYEAPKDCAGYRGRCEALFQVSSSEPGALEEEQRDHEDRDHPEDYVAVERHVHTRRRKEDATNQSDRNGGEHQHGEDVDRPGEHRVARAREMEADDPVDQEIDRPDGDHDEAPEDERVRESADVVRPLQELALPEIHDELVAHPPPGVIDPRFVATEAHVPVEAPRAEEERAETKEREDQEERSGAGVETRDDAAAGRRDHSLRISSAMTSFMISLVPS